MEGVPAVSNQNEKGGENRIEKGSWFSQRVLRPLRSFSTRLIGSSVLAAAALAPQAEAQAGTFDVVGQQVAATVFNQAGAPYGVTVQQGWNGAPVINYNPALAQQIARERAQQEALKQQQMRQMQERAALEQMLRNPTQVTFSNEAKAAIEKYGLAVESSGRTLYLFHPDSIDTRLPIKGDNVKFTNVDISMFGTSDTYYKVGMKYVVLATGKPGEAAILLKYDPSKKAFTQLKD